MSAPVELIPFNCLRCGYALPAALDEIAWVCSQCGEAAFASREVDAIQAALASLDAHARELAHPPFAQG